jgi:Mg-chelatase subunit ChlD
MPLPMGLTKPRRWATLLGLALSAIALAVPTASGSAPRIAVTRVDTQRFPLVLVTVRVPAGATKRPVHARENGRPIRWHLAQGAARQAIALSVDTSNSMKGERIAAVLKAAVAFVRQQPRGVSLGVYSFAAQAHPAAPFPATHQAAVDTLRRLGPAGADGTALYASIVQAVSGLSRVDAARRAMILVTDGQSFRDHSTLAKAIKSAQRARVSVYPVAIVTPVLDAASLRRLAHATGGQLSFARRSGDVDRLYRLLARRIAAARTYSYLSNAHSYQALHLVVSMKGHGTVRVNAPPAAPGSRPTAHPHSGTPMSTLAALIVAAACLLFGVAFLLARVFARF